MAVAVAVIGKENSPLFVKTVTPCNELKFLYTIHTSLDVVEEKISPGNKSSGDVRELYLGLLYPTEDCKVYGYVTNTKTKFIVIVETSRTTLRDNEIRQASEVQSCCLSLFNCIMTSCYRCFINCIHHMLMSCAIPSMFLVIR
ncbi:unnamed protein product [Ixodes pacificus]